MSKNEKLNDLQIADIRKRVAAGEDQSDVARAYGVTRQLVWYHVKAKPRSRKALKFTRVKIEGTLS